jgi:hypothetical protein
MLVPVVLGERRLRFRLIASPSLTVLASPSIDQGPVTRGGSLLPNERISEDLHRDDLRLDADLARTIYGFDAFLVLTGSTASANL